VTILPPTESSMDKVCKHEYTHNPQSHSETQSFQFLNKSHNLQIKSLAEQWEQHDSSKKKKQSQTNYLKEKLWSLALCQSFFWFFYFSNLSIDHLGWWYSSIYVVVYCPSTDPRLICLIKIYKLTVVPLVTCQLSIPKLLPLH